MLLSNQQTYTHPYPTPSPNTNLHPQPCGHPHPYPYPSSPQRTVRKHATNSNDTYYGNGHNYEICEVQDPDLVITEFVAETLLPTIHGKFRIRGYRHSIDGGKSATEPVAIIVGRVEEGEGIPVRVHDACFTSEVLGSLKCDCAQQLELALNMIQDEPPGMIIYLQQEGRGIGLANKIAAYKLQEEGLDTVDANRALGLPDDCREYTSVLSILRDLNIKSIKLMTNNPRKIDSLRSMGIEIVDRIPVLVIPGKDNLGYLEAKRTRMDHQLDGSFCWWNHEGEQGEPSLSLFDRRGGMKVQRVLGSHVVQQVQSTRSKMNQNSPKNDNGQQQ